MSIPEATKKAAGYDLRLWEMLLRRDRDKQLFWAKYFPPLLFRITTRTENLGRILIIWLALNSILHSKLCMFSERIITQFERALKLDSTELSWKSLNKKEHSVKSLWQRDWRSHSLLRVFPLIYFVLGLHRRLRDQSVSLLSISLCCRSKGCMERGSCCHFVPHFVCVGGTVWSSGSVCQFTVSTAEWGWTEK